MAENSINFTQYKIYLICLKYIPFLVAVLSLIASILGCLGISIGLFPVAAYMGLLPTIFWILSSFTFKCCIWHRLPIYYCWVNNVVSWIDFRWTIPFNNLQMILVYSIVALVFIILGMYFKNKYNVKQRLSKTSTT